MKTFAGAPQLILRGLREPQRGGAGAVASWTAAALRRFGTHADPLKSARGLAQSKTWRRFDWPSQDQSAFTMVEIAICLAIIGVALVSIIGVLPIGMRTQRDNREETVINQDATVFLEAIRSGARGLNDLPNYVYAITNYQTLYNPNPNPTVTFGWTNGAPSILTNGMNIIGLLSTPEYTDTSTNRLPIPNLMFGGYSNHVVAYVRSLSGPAVEKPPQDNDIVVGDSFTYRILCVNAPVATDTNLFFLYPAWQPQNYFAGDTVFYNWNYWQAEGNTIASDVPGLFGWKNVPVYGLGVTTAMRELRLTFLWPQLPNGSLGAGRQTFRTMVAGQMTQVSTNNQWLYFYQSQSYTNVAFAQ